jgi:hypothetical protein
MQNSTIKLTEIRNEKFSSYLIPLIVLNYQIFTKLTTTCCSSPKASAKYPINSLLLSLFSKPHINIEKSSRDSVIFKVL